MAKFFKKLNDTFGFPVAVIGVLLAIYFWYQAKPEITYEVLSESSVMDVKEKIKKIRIFFEGTEIYASNKDLVLVTVRVINSGKVNILSSQFDQLEDWGMNFGDSKIINIEMLQGSSDYVAKRIQPELNGANEIVFKKIMLDSGQYFVMKALLLRNIGQDLRITPMGKISGIENIKVRKIYVKGEEETFRNQVFAGSWYVQVTRIVAYTALFIFVIILTGTVLQAPIRYGQIRQYQKMGETKGNLGSLKSAASIYYGDNHGQWPKSLEDIVPAYLNHIPPEKITNCNRVVSDFDGRGGWVYNNNTGAILLNVKGKDLKGLPYEKYGLE